MCFVFLPKKISLDNAGISAINQKLQKVERYFLSGMLILAHNDIYIYIYIFVHSFFFFFIFFFFFFFGGGIDHKLPGRSEAWYRHVVYAPSMFGGYSASVFPGIAETIDADWTECLAQSQYIKTAIDAASTFLTS